MKGYNHNYDYLLVELGLRTTPNSFPSVAHCYPMGAYCPHIAYEQIEAQIA